MHKSKVSLFFLCVMLAGCTSSAYQLESQGRYSEAAQIYESEIESQRFSSWKLSKLSEAAEAYNKAGQQDEVLRLAGYAMSDFGYYDEVMAEIEGGVDDTYTERYQISVVSSFANAVVPVLYARRPYLAKKITNDFLGLRNNLAYYWDVHDYINEFQRAVNEHDKKSAMQLYLMRLSAGGSDSYSLYDEAAGFAEENGFKFLAKQILRQKQSFERLALINQDRPFAQDYAAEALYEVQDAMQYSEMKQANLACYKQAKALYFSYKHEEQLASLQRRQLAQQRQEETLNVLNQLLVGASALSGGSGTSAFATNSQSSAGDMSQMLGSLAREMQRNLEEQEKLELQNKLLTEEMKSSALSEGISEMDLFGSCQAIQ